MRIVMLLRQTAAFLFFGLMICEPYNGICQSEPLPVSTAIPVSFPRTIDAGKIQPGAEVVAKTIQIVTLPGGRSFPKGTEVVGHVTEARAYRYDQAPYAHQKSSYLAIHFDRIQTGNSTIPVNLTVRALADSFESDAAERPHYLDDTDHLGVMIWIGGGEFSPLDKTIKDEDGDAIGYNRKHGVFARLISSGAVMPGSTTGCDGTDTEQSVSIFSPSACGLYGLDATSMPQNGGDGSGTFRLESRRHSVTIYANSAALLEEVPTRPQVAQTDSAK